MFSREKLVHKDSRRRFLKQAASLGAWHAATCSTYAHVLHKVFGVPSRFATVFSNEEDSFLQELESANFSFFWEQADPHTGLVRDRCDVRKVDNRNVASIAATGFGFTALCIGQKRGFVAVSAALDRVISGLRFLLTRVPHHRGLFYHWLDIKTGERIWDSEVSPIDTAILLCGILTCREYFQNAEVAKLVDGLFNRVEWTWVSEDTALLSQGWAPEIGFLPTRWDEYSEIMMMYLLGLGSTSHPLPVETWEAWKRRVFEYDGVRYIGSFAPLFVHLYSQAWFDFRGKRDRFADYFQNSVAAIDAHRRFCLELAKEYPSYSDDLWGISASDSDKGYVIWGGPPRFGPIDGTVVPSAAAGSLPFVPRAAMRVLNTIRNRYKAAWSHYGFVNSFNPLKNWYDSDVIGLDTGITMAMVENARTGFVWETFMRSPIAKRGLRRAGFRNYSPSSK